jgi:hypothetical protein
MSLEAIAALLGHYVGDFVKRIRSEGVLIESGEQSRMSRSSLIFGGGHDRQAAITGSS